MFSIFPVQADTLNASCTIGSSSTGCEAYSLQEIYNLYGTTTDSTYYISVGGSSTQVYGLMNRTGSDNGAWILMMKGIKGSTNFGYSSTTFTSKVTTLNPSSLSNDVTTDAKFDVYNSLSVKKVLAVFQSPTNGSYSSNGDIQNNTFGGHVWMETLSATATLYSIFTTANTISTGTYTNTRESLYKTSTGGTQVFSYQSGYASYGFNQTVCGSAKYARWGILFNNESDYGSCDTYVGIGLASHNPGDQVTWTGSGTYPSQSTTGKGDSAFQIWGKLADPSLASPRSLSVSQASPTSVNVSWMPPATGSVTEYILQYKTSASNWSSATTRRVTSITTTPTVTVTGLAAGTYDYRVWARNSANSQSSATPVSLLNSTLDTTAPTITGPGSATGSTSSISIAENSTAVNTFTANESVTWSKAGTDGSFFTINSSGVLTITSRNFESPADANTDNVYVVTVTATDGSGNATTQTVSVTITNVNEAPTISTNASAATYSISQNENIQSVVNYTATDVDSGSVLSWSLSGTDAGDFSIVSNTGELTFTVNPDYEAPVDSNLDNIYTIIIQVSDGSLTDTQTLTVTITNANESASLGTPTLSATPYKGVNVTITVSSSVAGKLRFFFDGKRISTCLSKSTTGTYPNYSATCTWKPPVTSQHVITATITPIDNTFSTASSPSATIWVLKRTTQR